MNASAASTQAEIKACGSALSAFLKKPKSVKDYPTKKCPLIHTYITWQQLKKGMLKHASFEEHLAFLSQNPDWPDRNLIICNAESRITAVTPTDLILQWFHANRPVTGHGALSYLLALERTAPLPAHYKQMVADFWITLDFNGTDEKTFLKYFGNMLTTQDHERRCDRLIWECKTPAVKRLFPLLSQGYRMLANTRLALGKFEHNVDKMIQHLPAELQKNMGLAYDHSRWKRHNKMADTVAPLLQCQIAGSEPVLHVERFWKERLLHARAALGYHEYQQAYDLIANSPLTAGPVFSEIEWLAGWLSLRFLHQTDTAIQHFSRLYAGVKTTVSQSKAAYWLAQAYIERGDTVNTHVWYLKAARHPTTFYGQLSLQALGQPLDSVQFSSHPARVVPKDLETNPLVQMVQILSKLGHRKETKVFFIKLAYACDTVEEQETLVRLARELGSMEIAVHISKIMNRVQSVTSDDAYPVCLPLPTILKKSQELNLAPELVLALMRQESGCGHDVESHAGAKGLMQIMTPTAKMMAKRLKMPFNAKRLTQDKVYNFTLGVHHFAEVLERHDGNIIVALAAYNAGEGSVRKWVKQFGASEPHQEGSLEWLESFPYEETRSYVHRVLEGVPYYRGVLCRMGLTDKCPASPHHN